MEPIDHGAGETIRLSNSPRRSPNITQRLKSPVRSLHPQLQQAVSSHSGQDPGMRNLDFFDDSSGDEDNSPTDPADTAPDVERRGSATKKRQSNPPVQPMPSLASQCESRSVKLSPTQDGYQPLSPTVWQDAHDQLRDRAGTPSTSFNGSVDELLPNNIQSSPPPFLRSSRISSGQTPRSSAHIPRSDDRQSSVLPPRPTTTLGAYAIAHEITLQALMRDEEALERSLQSLPLAPLQPTDRRSVLQAALSMKDDSRSPQSHKFSTPQTANGSKKVHIVPPPIDIHNSEHRSLPNDIIRTPYPFSPDHLHRKDFTQQQAAASISTHTESVLTLSVRRTHATSKPRITTLAIPTANDFTAVRHSGLRQKEQHFQALDFDDAAFFRQLRAAYRELCGPWRLTFSARSLARILVASSTHAEAGDGQTGWHHAPRSPRELVHKGLNDTFGEEKLLQQFRRPAAGKGQHAFVHWAHRLAGAPATPRTGDSDGEGELVRRAERAEGLEFVLCWSAVRIACVLLAVLGLSVAAALLWTLLGKSTIPGVGGDAQAGFRGAEDRVVGGALMGIGVLLLGLSGMAGWLGLSWLLM